MLLRFQSFVGPAVLLARPIATSRLPPFARCLSPMCSATASPLPPRPSPTFVPPPHPTNIPVDQLLKDCTVKHTKGSGPGGQHRNKVATAIVLTHTPTGATGAASESRSQQTNHATALKRLRLKLALSWRTDAPLGDDATEPKMSATWKGRLKSGKLQINEGHEDFPTILAEALDVIWACNDVKAAADSLGVSTSQMVKLLAKEPAALQMVNQLRASQGMLALKAR